MKRTVIFSFLVLLGIFVAEGKTDHLLDFKGTSYDFGTVKESSAPVVHEYEFINTSDQPVAVLSVSTGCGCTRPEYPVKPLAPGEKSVIKITFMPEGQSGEINKNIQVRYRGAKASSSKRITLRLKGVVSK